MLLKENLTLDEERALYGYKNTEIKNCVFEGPADGESALKECFNIVVDGCTFALRYPLWHVKKAQIKDSCFEETCRAPLWYSTNLSISQTKIHGVKTLRECRYIDIEDSHISSEEFGWFCKNINIKNSDLEGFYPFFKSEKISADNLNLKGKYSFQYVKNITIRNSILDTKDAFWHAKNVTVYDSVIKGEYLGWYSDSLKLIRCRIEGTQPLCYAKNLVLDDCEMISADLSFERSHVNATIKGSIESVKNPLSGKIEAYSIGEIIFDDSVKSDCIILSQK